MESKERRFGCAVINSTCESNEGRKTCDAHYVAFFLSQHVWQEFLDGTPMTQEIDVKHSVQICLRNIENSPRVTNARVVDQYGW
jgi:hypothetical protein